MCVVLIKCDELTFDQREGAGHDVWVFFGSRVDRSTGGVSSWGGAAPCERGGYCDGLDQWVIMPPHCGVPSVHGLNAPLGTKGGAAVFTEAGA